MLGVTTALPLTFWGGMSKNLLYFVIVDELSRPSGGIIVHKLLNRDHDK